MFLMHCTRIYYEEQWSELWFGSMRWVILEAISQSVFFFKKHVC